MLQIKDQWLKFKVNRFGQHNNFNSSLFKEMHMAQPRLNFLVLNYKNIKGTRHNADGFKLY